MFDHAIATQNMFFTHYKIVYFYALVIFNTLAYRYAKIYLGNMKDIIIPANLY